MWRAFFLLISFLPAFAEAADTGRRARFQKNSAGTASSSSAKSSAALRGKRVPLSPTMSSDGGYESEGGRSMETPSSVSPVPSSPAAGVAQDDLEARFARLQAMPMPPQKADSEVLVDAFGLPVLPGTDATMPSRVPTPKEHAKARYVPSDDVFHRVDQLKRGGARNVPNGRSDVPVSLDEFGLPITPGLQEDPGYDSEYLRDGGVHHKWSFEQLPKHEESRIRFRQSAARHARLVEELKDIEGKESGQLALKGKKKAVQQSAKDLQGAYDDYWAAHKEYYADQLSRTSQRGAVKKSAYRVPSVVHEVASRSKDKRYQVAVSHLPAHWAGQMETFKEETRPKPAGLPSPASAPHSIPRARLPARSVHPDPLKGLTPPRAIPVH